MLRLQQALYPINGGKYRTTLHELDINNDSFFHFSAFILCCVSRRRGTPRLYGFYNCPFSIINYQKSLPSEIEQQGFPLFEIPLLSFARLPAEHKLYITLLLILTPLVLLRRVLAFSSSSALKDRAMGWLAWTINFSINLFIFHFHPHGILCKPLPAGG